MSKKKKITHINVKSNLKPILWKDISPKIKFGMIQDLFYSFGLTDGLRLCHLSRDGMVVLLRKATNRKIRRHLKKNEIELGGLLVGKIYRVEFNNRTAFITIITNSIPSENYDSTSVSLRMGAEVWDSAHNLLDEKLMVVGWYHSHPGFGAFFSSIDRKTQQSFFYKPFHVGLVVDPIKREEKWFYGKDSKNVRFKFNYSL